MIAIVLRKLEFYCCLVPNLMLWRALASLLLLTPCVADAGAVIPQGVWSGTIGTKAIVACFDKASSWTRYGSYYYVDHLKPISLTTRETDSYWHEKNDTGYWELAAPIKGIVDGIWRNQKSEKFLPIKLAIVDGADDDAACARDSYNSRLESNPKIEIGKIIEFSPGRSYRKLQFAGQETVRLIGPDPALGQLNAFLKLDQSKATINRYFQQRRESLARTGVPAVDERHTEPKYWDSNFITINFYLWAANEGRQGISNEYRTWNVRTGDEIDLWQWIDESSGDSTLPAKLKKFLFKNIQETPECANGYRGEGIFTLRIDKSGINIYEEAWGNGCENSFFISYEKLKPFLSPAGKRAVRSIVSHK